MKFEHLEKELTYLRQKYLYRQPKTFQPISATRIQHNGKQFLMLASNNYLGLTHHPAVQKAALTAINRYGTGSGGSRLISGSHPLFAELEHDLADFKHTERALIFNTGYMANVSTISTLVSKNDFILSDELNHASIIDGCRLSRAQCFIYRHKDINQVKKILQNLPANRTTLIITDSIFSMNGDIAPLEELSFLAEKYNALLMVDDAHATGVLGNGHGSAEHFHLQGKIDIQLGTLSKSLASVGGFVAGKKILIEYLINKSRGYIFSTALSPADIASAKEALHIISTDTSFVQKLWQNVCYLKKALLKYGIVINSDTPIMPIIVHDNEKALQIEHSLYNRGIILSAVRPPTVAPNESRLRLTVTAAHSFTDLDFAAEELGRALENLSCADSKS